MTISPEIEIRMLTLGIAATNCYIVGDKQTGEALVIDPVDEAELIAQTAEEAGFKIKLLLATHGHFDHVLASKALKELTQAPFYINQQDMMFLETLPEQGLRFTDQRFPEAAVPDRFLKDTPETLTLGNITLETLYTPGHSPGHIAFYMRDAGVVFGGDALFQGSIGRTDLPGGNYQFLMQSIINQLLPLGDEVRVLSGHGDMTTIGEERRTNPFILQYLR